MNKVVRIGTMPLPHGAGNINASIYCRIETKPKGDGITTLSISGVIGPKANGNALGGCGQISMEFDHANPGHNDRRTRDPIKASEITYAPGWNAALWLRFLDVWESWHLNDLKPNCAHQRGDEWDTQRELTLYHFRLRKAVEDEVRAAKHKARDCIKSGETFTPTKRMKFLANLPDKFVHHESEPPRRMAQFYCPNAPQYKGDSYNRSREVKTAGWVGSDEHPLGLLCKPCVVCGYKYGSAWNCEPLPTEVVMFLHSLPATDQQPAWC